MNRLFKIEIENYQAVWHPGDVVKGRVILNLKSQANIESISVDLSGRAKALDRDHQQYDNYLGRGVLLFQPRKITLLQGPYTLPAGQKSWLFELKFPEDCKEASFYTSGPFKYDPSSLFNMQTTEPLPPSFTAHSTLYKKCIVRYAITAEMDSSTWMSGGDEAKSTRFDLVFRPLRPGDARSIFTRLPRTLRIESKELDPTSSHGKLSFRDKLKSMTQSAPAIIFTINAQLPTSMGLDEPIRPRLFFEQHPDRSTASTFPDVYLISVNLELLLHVNGRGYGVITEPVFNWSEEHPIAGWTGQELLYDGFSVSELFPNGIKVPTNFAPTFSTINISIHYQLKIRYTILCAGKQVTSSAQTKCRLFSDEIGRLTAAVNPGPQREIELPPPAYNEIEDRRKV